ncbi:MAG TPA: YraN family protein [Solirubrobacteraceae bacterium]|jgi:putative endonuclease|nr:YraN family protein [Solirubrobacteraceae bacterium]
MLSQDSPDPDADPAPAPDPSPPPGEDPRRTLGRLGEDLAAAHFERLGFSALGRNERTRYGEIDLIAFDGYTLVFAEVKTRRVSAYKHGIRPDQQPLAWLNPRQSERLRQLAAAWLYDKQHIRPTAHTIRFDAIGVIVDTNDKLICLDHIEGAW